MKWEEIRTGPAEPTSQNESANPIQTLSDSKDLPSEKMKGLRKMGKRAAAAVAAFMLQMGCSLPEYNSDRVAASPPVRLPSPVRSIEAGAESVVVQASYQDPGNQQAKPDADALPNPRPIAGAAAVGKVSLDQIINTVLIADPRIRAGLELINQSNADALTASLKPNPQLFTDVQLLPLSRPFTVDQQGGPPQQDIMLSYPIDWFLFGKRAAAMQAAALGVRTSEAEYADLVRRRVLEAATAYYDVLEAKALLGVAEQDVENLTRIETLTEKAVEGGARPRVELDRIRLDRMKSEQVLRDARNTVVVATATLRSLMGQADEAAKFEVGGTLDTEPEAVTMTVEASLMAAVENRPDLQALRWRVSHSQATVETERRKAFPDVTPAAGYTRQYQQSIGFPNANSYGFSLTMSLPFHDRNQGNRQRAASVLTQSQFELQAGLVSLRAEITQAVEQLKTSGANAKSVAGEQLKLAQQVRDSIRNSYEAGGRTLLDVLDAQRNYRETYRLYITSRAGYGRALMRFNAAMGRKVAP